MRHHAASTPDSMPPASLTNQITPFALEMAGKDWKAPVDSHTILTESNVPYGRLTCKRTADRLGVPCRSTGATLP
jgi:hypothetical protein